MKLGYIRVSTKEQHVDRQIDELKKYGILSQGKNRKFRYKCRWNFIGKIYRNNAIKVQYLK